SNTDRTHKRCETLFSHGSVRVHPRTRTGLTTDTGPFHPAVRSVFTQHEAETMKAKSYTRFTDPDTGYNPFDDNDPYNVLDPYADLRRAAKNLDDLIRTSVKLGQREKAFERQQ